MARARNIKPGFFKNEDLAECTPFARLCFAGLWTMADREGRLEDRPKRIKGELFPYDSVEVEPLLEELVRWGFIRRYQVGGERFIFILKFVEHQAPHGTEKDGTIPDENGFLTIHERGKNGYITGNYRLEPHALTVKATSQTSNQPATDNESLTVKPPSPDGGQNTLIPDSGFLIPDSPILNPDSEEKRAPLHSAGEACKAMKAVGLPGVNPSHPDLVRLLAAGVTAQELADCAVEAVSTGKRTPFAWVLATVEGRRRDAAQRGAVPPAQQSAPTETPYERKARERMNAWAPGVAKRAPQQSETVETEARDVSPRALG
ncbi:hypothetical protein [Variovorax atrisoli]|uniref:hypothetical protein n=1 Tax=Variovorax atrisoli TaxID=3394203 RepID=UPI00036E6262|nr:hypothetical protein [Variovorax paradoxus]